MSVPDPVILLVAPDPETAEVLVGEFSRYQRDYDVRTAATADQARDLAAERCEAGAQVALFVTRSRLDTDAHPDTEPPTVPVLHAIREWRAVVPTARVIVTAAWEDFGDDAEALRPALAKGKYDAFLLLPRGRRDEEFHAAVVDLLSDWGSTVAAPEVAAIRIVTPEVDALTLAIRDFLDRMGMPNLTSHPDSTEGRAALAQLAAAHPDIDIDTDPPPDADPAYPLVQVLRRGVMPVRSVHDVAVAVYGRPDEIEVDTVVDLCGRIGKHPVTCGDRAGFNPRQKRIRLNAPRISGAPRRQRLRMGPKCPPISCDQKKHPTFPAAAVKGT